MKSRNGIGEVCEDCIAYDPQSKHDLNLEPFPIQTGLSFNQDTNFEAENNVVWPNEVVCSHKQNGYDQPGNDLLDQPLFVFRDSDCCKACNEYGSGTIYL